MINLPKETGDWLTQCLGMKVEIRLLAADASFRNYYRIRPVAQSAIRTGAHSHPSLVLMHAPPDQEDLRTYLHLAQAFARQGVRTPHTWYSNLQLGLAVIEDFGDDQLNNAPIADPATANWYQLSLQQLFAIGAAQIAGLPDFCRTIYPEEMQLLPQWATRLYPLAYDQPRWHSLCESLGAKLAAMPGSTCHRDFHSRNLLRLPQQAIGVIDFQDACIAPRAYDLASLLFDAYTDLPPSLASALTASYAQHWQQSIEVIQHELHLTALQRLLKVYGIFCRLHSRDNKSGYLACLPRIATQLRRIAAALIAAGESWLTAHQPLIHSLGTARSL